MKYWINNNIFTNTDTKMDKNLTKIFNTIYGI